jgi:DNA polymerase
MVDQVNLVTLDFETYYDREYSLSKMSTEDYITDPRFEVILVAAKVGDSETEWFSGSRSQTGRWLAKFDLPRCGVVGHNMMFDATILQQVFGIRPGFIFDTISMAQAHIRPFSPKVSLKACLEHCDFDGLRKGEEVHNMIGRTRLSLTEKELGQYANYCCTDVEGTYRLFQHLKPLFPRSEFIVMDQTHRMYLDPVLELDAKLLAEIKAEEIAKKEHLLASLDQYCTKDQLMSNDKFAEVLQRAGVAEVPMKISLTTGKPAYAFAKGDAEFKRMQEEYADDDLVTALIDARLGVKSTIKETRSGRLLDIALRHRLLRVPLNYYAAHTGRYGGTQKINMQNPPRIDRRLGRRQIRYAMRAPKGHVVLAADLSQIEARIVAWMAGCYLLVDGFVNHRDIYADFATRAYSEETVKGRSQEDDNRRFVGKTCILGLGYGMGPDKLKVTLNKDGVKVPLTESQRLVNVYRDVYHEIPKLWRRMDNCLGILAGSGGKAEIGPVSLGNNMVVLPNGMPIYYNNLSRQDGEWWYTFGRESRKLFGGKLTENIVQALARNIVMENMITIRKELGLQMVLQVHDELDYVVPEGQAEECARQIEEIMSTPPSWASDLPVAVEIGYGPTFGDCK